MTDTPSSAPGWVKPVLEFGSVAAYLVVYLRIKDQVFTLGGTDYSGFIVATAIFIPLMLLSTLLLWRIDGKLPVMQVFSAALVVVLGGMTLWLNDPQFIKMKPTLLYTFFALLLGAGAALGRNPLRIVLGEALHMVDAGWRVLTWRFAGFMLVMAGLNELVWRSFSDQTWIYFKLIGFPVLLIGFMMAQSGVITRYGASQD